MLRRNCNDPNVQFEILSNPEFLAEGTAIEVGMSSGQLVGAHSLFRCVFGASQFSPSYLSWRGGPGMRRESVLQRVQHAASLLRRLPTSAALVPNCRI